MKKALLFVLFLAAPAFGQNTVQSTLFGADFNGLGSPVWCPTDGLSNIAKIKRLRIWDSGAKWSQVETSASSPTTGVYKWTVLDKAVNTLATNASCPMSVLYAYGSTPSFASAGALPANNCAAPSTQFSCTPPSDVNGDGTGADAWLMNFVGNLVSRYAGKIGFYELWNEADSPNFFCWNDAVCGGGGSANNPRNNPNVPSLKNLVLMSWDTKKLTACIDPAAVIVGVGVHVGTAANGDWFDNFVNTSITAPARNITVAGHTCSWGSQTVTGKDTFTPVNIHARGTSSNNSDPTQIIAAWTAITGAMTRDGLTGRDLWNTEFGYNGTAQAANADIQAAYVAIEYALCSSLQSPPWKFCGWYTWDAGQGPLQGHLPGTAYDTAASWYVGSSVNLYSLSGTIYSITGTTSGGKSFKVTWDMSKNCNSGCTTGNQSEPGFTSYQDITGVSHSISGTAPVGLKPIFLIGTATTANPSCSPAGGSFAVPQSVTCSDSGSPAATICWNFNAPPTTNGNGVCTSGNTYSGAITVNVTSTLELIATQAGQTDSPLVTYSFTITPVVNPPPAPATNVFVKVVQNETIPYLGGKHEKTRHSSLDLDALFRDVADDPKRGDFVDKKYVRTGDGL